MSRGQRAVGYVRVSTEEQTEGHSLDAQRREIGRYCERHEFELVRIYADEGVSAHTEKIERRPQLVALLEDAGRREFDVVIVHTIDRWARNVGVQRQALQRLGEANVGFASVTENIDFTTPAGKLMLTMIGGVSEFFSDQLAVHVSKGQRERAESGLPVGSVPFGYITHEPGAVPTVVPREAGAVLEAFRRRARGESYGAIARWLNAEGFETRGDNAVFTSFAVKDMLNCRFYQGLVTYKGAEFPGRHEAIVDQETFEAAQARRGAARQRRLMVGQRGLLQGRVSCGHCGETLQSDRDYRGRAMYRERHGSRCRTNNRSLMAVRVDAQLGAIWKSLEFAQDWRARMAELASANYDGPSPEELASQRRRLARAYADGGLSEAEYESRVAEIDHRVQRARKPSGPSFEEAAALFSDMPRLWEQAEMDERRRLIDPLIERVYLDIDSKRIGAIKPTPEFRILIDHALDPPDNPDVFLIPPGNADGTNIWRWWRRGRIELPVQNTAHTDLLRA
jgi:site-specific DNA recombinase